MEEFRRIYNFPEKKVSDSNSENDTDGFVPTLPQFSGVELAKEVIPVEFFFNQNRYLSEIVSFRENDKEARARVKFGGWDGKTEEQFGDIEYDIFLYKEKNGWKIFKVKLSNQNDKYDTYKFYAASDNP